MSRLYYSPYRHFRVVILLHRIRNRMNELFVRIKKVRAKAKVIHYSLKYRKLQSQQVWCHNHNVPTTFDHLQEVFPRHPLLLICHPNSILALFHFLSYPVGSELSALLGN